MIRFYDSDPDPLAMRLTRLAYANGRHEVATRACDMVVDDEAVHIEAGQALTLAQALVYPFPVEVSA